MAEVRVSQIATLVELAMQGIWASQLATLVEIDQVQVRASQVVLLVEFEFFDDRPRPTGGLPSATVASSPAGRPAPVSERAAAAAGEAFAALAVAAGRVQSFSLAALAPQATGEITVGSVKRSVLIQVGVCWSRDGTTFVDESARLVSARGSYSLTAPEQMLAGGRGAVGSCSITLANDDGRFSPSNGNSPLHAYLAGGGAYLAQVRIDVTINGETKRVFTGVLREMNETAATATGATTVTLECRTRDELLLQNKLSTPLVDFLADSQRRRFEDYYIVRLLQYAGQTDGIDFVSQAYAQAHNVAPTIDPGIFPLRYVWLDDESILDELWNLVAACCGWFYCDADGRFHYHNITGILPASLQRQYGAVATIEVSEADITQLSLRWPTSELYSEIAVEVAPRAPGDVGMIWEPDDPIVVQPGQTKTVWARLTSAQTKEPALAWRAYTAGGSEILAGINVTQINYAQRVKLVISNTTTQAAYLNIMQLNGQVLDGGRTLEVERASANAFWTGRPPRRRSIRSNVYIQSEAQAETIAAYTLRRQERPVLIARLTNLDRHDVRLGWPVRIQYQDNVTTPIIGIISEVMWRADMTGFRQDVAVLETASLFAGVDPFFILGTHRLGASGGPGEAYLYY
jgi:hypothetical protein